MADHHYRKNKKIQHQVKVNIKKPIDLNIGFNISEKLALTNINKYSNHSPRYFAGMSFV